MKNQKTYHRQTAKFITKVSECLPELSSEDMQAWIENPKELSRVLKDAIRFPEKTSTFDVFITLQIGTCEQGELLRALFEDGNKVTEEAVMMIESGPFFSNMAAFPGVEDVCIASTLELTGRRNASYQEVIEAVKEAGYYLCSSDVGPYLRIQHKGNETINVVMDPILSHGRKTIFQINSFRDEKVLDSVPIYGSDIFPKESLWAFLKSE